MPAGTKDRGRKTVYDHVYECASAPKPERNAWTIFHFYACKIELSDVIDRSGQWLIVKSVARYVIRAESPGWLQQVILSASCALCPTVQYGFANYGNYKKGNSRARARRSFRYRELERLKVKARNERGRIQSRGKMLNDHYVRKY